MDATNTSLWEAAPLPCAVCRWATDMWARFPTGPHVIGRKAGCRTSGDPLPSLCSRHFSSRDDLATEHADNTRKKGHYIFLDAYKRGLVNKMIWSDKNKLRAEDNFKKMVNINVPDRGSYS